ncbi:transposase [Mobiluncus mulieris]|nr:transposase [Mobiluncus mulieris]
MRRTLKTGANLLTDKQAEKLQAIPADDFHAYVEAAWISYQDMMHAYRQKNRQYGKHLMEQVIEKLANIPKDIAAGLPELRRLGRTLKRRTGDILAYFDHPHSSNEPTEAINVRLEHLRGTTLGFRNFINYRIRALLETGEFKNQLHPQI